MLHNLQTKVSVEEDDDGTAVKYNPGLSTFSPWPGASHWNDCFPVVFQSAFIPYKLVVNVSEGVMSGHLKVKAEAMQVNGRKTWTDVTVFL